MLNWKDLPSDLKIEEVKYYYDILEKKKIQLFFKRCFDIFASIILLLFLSPFFLIISILIKIDSKGPIFYRQIRVTRYGKKFKIIKFRTMFVNDGKNNMEITVGNDPRITRVGKLIRNLRIDEIPQLINVLLGEMSFVGTRPEVTKYVEKYSNEMKATLLLRAGITSLASIEYRDESKLLKGSDDPEKVYVEIVLPEKMKINLRDLKTFSLFKDFKILFLTIIKVIK